MQYGRCNMCRAARLIRSGGSAAVSLEQQLRRIQGRRALRGDVVLRHVREEAQLPVLYTNTDMHIRSFPSYMHVYRTGSCVYACQYSYCAVLYKKERRTPQGLSQGVQQQGRRGMEHTGGNCGRSDVWLWCWQSGVPCALRWPWRRHCSRARAATSPPLTLGRSLRSSEAAASRPAQRGARGILGRGDSAPRTKACEREERHAL